ncbi:hypothetical protein ACFFIX_22270 [Metabacillus herbersteinensis]|uniref:Zinc ribbon domain-containing protein n=1 Tax=Metabacillus herbersteinensis TaxID=283816 RepID=A0ABV6GKT3_9BACI
MEKYYCTSCMQLLDNFSVCFWCGKDDVKPIIIEVQKQATKFIGEQSP